MRDIRTYIPVSMVVGLGILIVLISFIFVGTHNLMQSYSEESIRQKKREMLQQCRILSDYLMSDSFKPFLFPGEEDEQSMRDGSQQIVQVANSMNGRILILDRDFQVVVDTYGLNEQQYLLTDSISKVMGKELYQFYELEDKALELVYGVEDKESETTIGFIVMTISLSHRNDIMNYLREQRMTLMGIYIIIILFVCVFIYLGMRYCFVHVQKQLDHIEAEHQESILKEEGFYEFYSLSASFNRIIQKYTELEKSRQEFVANVSHELKTPITSMKVLADSLLTMGDVPIEFYQEFMQDIVHEIDRENQIITDLLELVKMDKTQGGLSVASEDINALLDVLIKRISPIAKKRNITLKLITMRHVMAEVDAGKLSLACNNLIENAVKYNKDGGSVEVHLNADHKFFYIRVRDTGVGIPEDCISHIFERFYRVDKARSRDTGGTGLGLAISRNIILLHKGSIKVHSTPGIGTTFTVRIPINYIGTN